MHPLKSWRVSRGLTQLQVAHAVHLKNRSAVAHWERGRSIPSLSVLIALAPLYNVTLETLITALTAYNDSRREVAA